VPPSPPGATSGLASVLAVLLLGSAGGTAAQDGEPGHNPTRGPLTVLPGDSPEHTGVEATRGSELWAEARLITTYSLNEHLNPFDIDVDVEGDTVILSGVLDSPAERDLAVRLARDLSGIDDEAGAAITSAAEGLSDTWLTARVAASLLFDRTVDAERIDVSTEDGVVTLSGQVPTAADKGEAGAVAGAIDGVERVENVLGVEEGAR
jgi:hyperosmotically inducible periplasmic protein